MAGTVVQFAEAVVCPECQHAVAGHRHHSDDSGQRYGSKFYCDERMSRENNDFCGCTHGAPKQEEPVEDGVLARFYAVRNSQGKYYRTYSRSRSSGWQDRLEDAKLWTKIGPAKAKITALSGLFSTPELVEFVVREVNVVDQKARVTEAKAKKAREEAERERTRKAEQLRYAQEELKRAEAKVKKLQGNT